MLGCIDCDGWSWAPDAGNSDRSPHVISEPPCELDAFLCAGVELLRCETDGWVRLQVCASAELCNPEPGVCLLPPEVDAGEVATDADSGPELLDTGQPDSGPDAASTADAGE